MLPSAAGGTAVGRPPPVPTEFVPDVPPDAPGTLSLIPPASTAFIPATGETGLPVGAPDAEPLPRSFINVLRKANADDNPGICPKSFGPRDVPVAGLASADNGGRIGGPPPLPTTLVLSLLAAVIPPGACCGILEGAVLAVVGRLGGPALRLRGNACAQMLVSEVPTDLTKELVPALIDGKAGELGGRPFAGGDAPFAVSFERPPNREGTTDTMGPDCAPGLSTGFL